jgi:hypothetical protein
MTHHSVTVHIVQCTQASGLSFCAIACVVLIAPCYGRSLVTFILLCHPSPATYLGTWTVQDSITTDGFSLPSALDHVMYCYSMEWPTLQGM